MNGTLLCKIHLFVVLTVLALSGAAAAQSYTVRMGNGAGIVNSTDYHSRVFLGRGMAVYPSQYDFSHMENGAILSKFAVTINEMLNGAITCFPPTVNFNASTLCTISPNAGHYINKILDNGFDATSHIASNSYLLKNVKHAHTIDAVFSKLADFNDDGNVDLVDAIIALQAMLPLSSTGSAIHSRAEINDDGKIGLADAIYLLQKAAELRLIGDSH